MFRNLLHSFSAQCGSRRPVTNDRVHGSSLHAVLWLCILLTSVLASCSIEKRSYRPGYHIDWQRRAATPHHSDSTRIESRSGQSTALTERTPVHTPVVPDSLAETQMSKKDDMELNIPVTTATPHETIGWHKHHQKKKPFWPRVLPVKSPGAQQMELSDESGIEVIEAPLSFAFVLGSIILIPLAELVSHAYSEVVLIVLGVLFLVGFILSIVALVRYKTCPNQRGRSLAIAAFIIGFLMIIGALAMTILILWLFSW